MTIPIVGSGPCDARLCVSGDAVPSNQQIKAFGWGYSDVDHHGNTQVCPP